MSRAAGLKRLKLKVRPTSGGVVDWPESQPFLVPCKHQQRVDSPSPGKLRARRGEGKSEPQSPVQQNKRVIGREGYRRLGDRVFGKVGDCPAGSCRCAPLCFMLLVTR